MTKTPNITEAQERQRQTEDALRVTAAVVLVSAGIGMAIGYAMGKRHMVKAVREATRLTSVPHADWVRCVPKPGNALEISMGIGPGSAEPLAKAMLNADQVAKHAENLVSYVNSWTH